MTVPQQYRDATRDFELFMQDLKAISMLQTTHQAYTMLQAVFQVFRRRLTPEQCIQFAAVLPPVLQAIFISDWNVSEKRGDFSSPGRLMAEVMALRHNHNVSTETAIQDVSAALCRHVDMAAFRRVLQCLPDGAGTFWLGAETR